MRRKNRWMDDTGEKPCGCEDAENFTYDVVQEWPAIQFKKFISTCPECGARWYDVSDEAHGHVYAQLITPERFWLKIVREA